MLELLHIENIAVIEQADIAISRLGSTRSPARPAPENPSSSTPWALCSGGRTSRDLIRTGADKAFVSAHLFRGPGGPAGPSGQRRRAGRGREPPASAGAQHREGKNLCRANGRPVTVAQLREIGRGAVEHPRPARRPAAAGRGAARRLSGPVRRPEPQSRESYAGRPIDAMAAICWSRDPPACRWTRRRRPGGWTALRIPDRASWSGPSSCPGRRRSWCSRRNLLRHGEKFLSAAGRRRLLPQRRRRAACGAVTLLQAGGGGPVRRQAAWAITWKELVTTAWETPA